MNEYIYTDSNSGHHHAYLARPILETIASDPEKTNTLSLEIHDFDFSKYLRLLDRF